MKMHVNLDEFFSLFLFCMATHTHTHTQRWRVFVHISELFILVPSLLGLKGNLDMCLASRLSTQANLGRMKSKSDIIHMVIGNIGLVQVQATVASFIVALFAIGVGSITRSSYREFEWSHAMLLIASSMFTATLSCFVLGEWHSNTLFISNKRITDLFIFFHSRHNVKSNRQTDYNRLSFRLFYSNRFCFSGCDIAIASFPYESR